MPRLCRPDYIPSLQDVLVHCSRTCGSTERTFQLGNNKIRVTDVGGARSERLKWGRIISELNVHLVIFCVSLWEYDLLLNEATDKNRLHESLHVWEQMSRFKSLETVHTVLLFTHADLFKEKIKVADLKHTLPDYDGGLHFDNALKFLQAKFLSISSNLKRIHPYVINTLDTDSVRDFLIELRVNVVPTLSIQSK